MTPRRFLTHIASLCGAVVLLLPGCSRPPLPPPNVFLVVLDTVRADHLSAYGYSRPTSPNLARIAAEGVLYENCISPSSWTLPSHASLFTGLYVRDHRTTAENRTLDEEFDTLAELFRNAGYRTGAFSNNVFTSKKSGLQQGFDYFREMWLEQRARKLGGEVDDHSVDMGGAATNDRLFEWLDGFPDRADPFFVFLNYFEPHAPYRPTAPYDDDFLPQGADPDVVSKLRSHTSPGDFGHMLGVPGMVLTDEEIEILVGLYDGEIAYLDWIIGRLVDGLEARGLLENTLLVLTSDHGEHLNEHGMLDHKFSLYDELVRVPLILHYPARLPAGRRVKTQVQSHHVFGTILRLAQLRDRVGSSLPLEDEKEPSRPYAFSEIGYPALFLDFIKLRLPQADPSRFARSLRSVQGPRYKLIKGSKGPIELYDLLEDPRESRNLAESEPEALERMQRNLEAFDRGEL